MPYRLIGRTAVFGTVSQGSSPCRATLKQKPLTLMSQGLLFVLNNPLLIRVILSNIVYLNKHK